MNSAGTLAISAWIAVGCGDRHPKKLRRHFWIHSPSLLVYVRFTAAQAIRCDRAS
jgi:hypothetical protein